MLSPEGNVLGTGKSSDKPILESESLDPSYLSVLPESMFQVEGREGRGREEGKEKRKVTLDTRHTVRDLRLPVL